MAVTRADIDAMKATLRTMIQRVQKGDRSVQYFEVEAQRQIIADAERELKGKKGKVSLVNWNHTTQ